MDNQRELIEAGVGPWGRDFGALGKRQCAAENLDATNKTKREKGNV